MSAGTWYLTPCWVSAYDIEDPSAPPTPDLPYVMSGTCVPRNALGKTRLDRATSPWVVPGSKLVMPSDVDPQSHMLVRVPGHVGRWLQGTHSLISLTQATGPAPDWVLLEVEMSFPAECSEWAAEALREGLATFERRTDGGTVAVGGLTRLMLENASMAPAVFRRLYGRDPRPGEL